MTHLSLSPALRGGLLALLAAALFGLSTPFVQLWGRGLGPFTTAGLLYGGAGLVALFIRRPREREAQLQRGDAGRLLAMAVFGAVIGPGALVWGLQRTSGTSASLMLTLEAFFTALLAWRLYGETVDRRVLLAMACLMAGGMVLTLDQGLQGNVQLLGLAAVMVATVAWGVDNTLSRGVADRDPGQVVLAKSSLGVVATVLLAGLLAEPMPNLLAAGVLLGWRDWLRSEPALLSARSAHLRRGTHGLSVCVRSVYWRTGCFWAWRARSLGAAGPRRDTDAGRGGLASD